MENKQPLYMNAACLVKKWIYFTSYNSSWLFRLNIETKDLEALYLLKDTKVGIKFSGIYSYNDKLWMIPWSADYIYIYDLNNSKLEQLALPKEMCDYNDMNIFRKSVVQGNYLWLLPCRYPGIIRIDMEEKSYKIFNDWPDNIYFDNTKKMNFKMMTLFDNTFYLFNDGCNMSIKLSTETGVMTEWKEGYNHSFGAISNNKLYTAPVKELETFKIIPFGDSLNIKNVTMPDKLWMRQTQYLYCYWYTKILGNKIFFMPHEANGLLVMDVESEKVDIFDIENSDYQTPREHKNYSVYDVFPYEDSYLLIPYLGNKLILFSRDGVIEKEIILEVDSKYLNISFFESDEFHLDQYIDIIRCIKVNRTYWNNDDYNQDNKSIGYKINKTIFEEIE